ncbi:crotonobetainyl-CoA:carnitine CoA-transferase CaiB-like acyl-CoA transferase [Prauserella shujinwangii]|uniref:Crotonobetainyl-CoA:carnitine CoA-transferase CaiB-like acyl-CoA transferase n=1 Tax=Prauserella shujinwangii TaxID=1453103 RepID=A0A2T0LSM8_9PSEU|nr:CoA transferase [Prauserella shujinwangii]PRX46679.1 crotonobetainyl-CoA:carnitine CoA-transferase CaiB-like acyl-CoA transferase [Prauserella shujinwangii]
MTNPLAGVRVVEFGHYIAAPAATQSLADLGAEVVKVEPPGGDQARGIGAYGEGIVLAYNRGKRSVVLDLKRDDDKRAALGLIAEADVVVQNLRAGAMARRGLGPDALLPDHPRLVYVSVSGFSSRGPSASRAGLDIAAQAESGLMSINGEQDGDPLRVGFPIADVAASNAVVQGVLAALLRRERTGRGGVIEVSLLDAMIHMQSAMWGEWHASGQEPRRKGNGQATVAPAADLVRTADGAIVLSAYTPEHFARLCELMGRTWMLDDPRFADNPSRVAHRDVLLAEISAAFGTVRTEDCLAALTERGLVAAAVRTYGEVAASADARSSGILTTGVTPDGVRYPIPSLPFTLDGVDPVPDRAVPEVGADTGTLPRDES